MHLYSCMGDAVFVPDGAHCISSSPAGRRGHIYPPYPVSFGTANSGAQIFHKDPYSSF